MEEFRRLKRDLVARGVLFDYYQDTMLIPNGNVAKWDLIDNKGAAAVVAVREDGKMLMVRQYRNALERETLELPAGGLNGRGGTHVRGGHAGAGGGNGIYLQSCGAAEFHLYHCGLL